MNRRTFLNIAGAGTAASLAGHGWSSGIGDLAKRPIVADKIPIQEHLGWKDLTDENLSCFKAIGVNYIDVIVWTEMKDGQDRTEYWEQARKRIESHGMKLYSVGVTVWDEITLGRPDRDKNIEAFCTILRNIAQVGVPTLGYNFKPAGNFRTKSTRGRGGVSYSTFDYEEFMRDPPHYPEKVISEEQMWENLRYFLERVIPVAEKAGIQMALHPDDPPIAEPMGGAARIVTSLANYRRVFDLVPSPFNAMLFCQGSVAEMGENIEKAIREMARRKKIIYVHFRNIRGTPRSFQEVFLDEGDVDMFRAMQVYKDAGFEGPFMMDHTPGFPQSVAGMAGRAFAVAYIRAMIQAVYR